MYSVKRVTARAMVKVSFSVKAGHWAMFEAMFKVVTGALLSVWDSSVRLASLASLRKVLLRRRRSMSGDAVLAGRYPVVVVATGDVDLIVMCELTAGFATCIGSTRADLTGRGGSTVMVAMDRKSKDRAELVLLLEKIGERPGS